MTKKTEDLSLHLFKKTSTYFTSTNEISGFVIGQSSKCRFCLFLNVLTFWLSNLLAFFSNRTTYSCWAWSKSILVDRRLSIHGFRNALNSSFEQKCTENISNTILLHKHAKPFLMKTFSKHFHTSFRYQFLIKITFDILFAKYWNSLSSKFIFGQIIRILFEFHAVMDVMVNNCLKWKWDV